MEFKDLVHQFGDVFRDELPNKVPPKREFDFEINLKHGQPLPVRPVISLSKPELVESKRQLHELCQKWNDKTFYFPLGSTSIS